MLLATKLNLEGVPKMSLLELFCKDFEEGWYQQLLTDGHKKRNRKGNISLSEMLTIVVHFHQIGFRNFKAFYLSR